MIDIRLVREHPEIVKETIKKKGKSEKLALLEETIKKDREWRALKAESDELRASRNTISKQISDAKKAGKSAVALLKKARSIPDKITQVESKASLLEMRVHELLKQLPNTMHSSVPLGKSDADNTVLEVIGKPGKFDFSVKSHAEIAEALGMADFDASARTSGNGFYYLQGDLALLNQALIRFGIDTMVSKGFTYVETPLLLRGEVIRNVTDLNDMHNQIYKTDDDLYLIGTSEHSLIGRHIDTILPEKQLPLKHTSYSMCFRKEIGSHGIDQKGLFRTHQFNKIEMIVVCTPDESMKHYEEMKSITIEIFKKLGIPIRVLAICSGDLGDLKHVQVDIEAWSPRTKSYFEVGSCSNLTDAQARRLKIRCDGATRYVPHTLNNTAIATSRALVAILENYQQKDGCVKIPDALQPYMHGTKFLGNKN